MGSAYSDTNVDGSGQYETKRETEKRAEDKVARWLAEIDLASNEEKNWRADAEKARNIYRAEKEGKDRRFNILYSNVRTECSALYNSTPVSDVRPRYNDQDETSRLTAQTIERGLSYTLDSYDIDGVIKAAVQDSRIAGRGVSRVRYCPYEYQGRVYEEVCCEHVLWKHFRRGPATSWSDVPWVAFELFLTRDQLTQLNPEIGGGINLDFALAEGLDQKPDAPPNVFKRARVWEIWDKATRKVIFIAPGYKSKPLLEEDDPLGLINFFPVPEPLYGDRTYDSLVPMVPYQAYIELADELEEVTLRIQALIKVIRWRGYQHPSLPSFERLEEAVDGELIPATEDVISLVQGGGLDKFIWLMPIEQAIKTLQQLYLQREQIKQSIYEISGLSDVQRGASDPNETLGAQEIKASFGSQRTQEQQKDVQRFCRDLMRLKSEIICNTFDPDNIKMMTGMQQPSAQEVQLAQQQLQQMQAQRQQMQAQAPQMGGNGGPPMSDLPPEQMQALEKAAKAVPWEKIVELLRGGVTRAYRIDIETDSTIRGEVRQQQQNAAQFLEGTASFVQAFAPAIESGMVPADVAVDIYSGFARFFRLGKQVEDALARMAQQAQEQARNPQPPPPSPEEIKAKMEQQKNEAQMGRLQQKHQMDMKAKDAEFSFKQKSAELDYMSKERSAQLDFAIKERQAELDAQAMHRDDLGAQRKAALDQFVATQKAKQAVQKPQQPRRAN
jgi:hypothetical protein